MTRRQPCHDSPSATACMWLVTSHSHSVPSTGLVCVFETRVPLTPGWLFQFVFAYPGPVPSVIATHTVRDPQPVPTPYMRSFAERIVAPRGNGRLKKMKIRFVSPEPEARIPSF